MNNLIEITNDLFDVAQRLKSVNENYVLYFNVQKQRYEVYENSHGFNLAFVVPYDELDARTVEYAKFTRVQNCQAVFDEIEKANRLAEERQCRESVERIFETEN